MALHLIAAALLPVIAEAAPRLVEAVTGSSRAGMMTQAVTGAVSAATGLPVRTAAQAEEAMRALKASPEAMAEAIAALRDVETAYLADVQDARARDIEIRRMNGGQNVTANWVAGAVFVGFFGSHAAMLLPDLTATAEASLANLSAGLMPIVGGIVGFFFGSSRASKDKDAVISGLMAPPATPRDLPVGRKGGGMFRR